MGFTSLDDLINKTTGDGNFYRSDWTKLTHSVGTASSATWYCFAHSAGNPNAMTLGAVGTNLAWHAAHDRAAGGVTHGGDVAPDTKHILCASAGSSAGASAPGIWMLVDMLGWYPITTTSTTGNQALINSKDFTVDAGTDVATLAATWDAQTGTAMRLTTTTTLPAPLATGTTYYWSRTGAGTGYFCTTRANAILGVGNQINITDTGTGTHTATMTLIDRCPSDGSGVQAFLTPSVALGAGSPYIQLTYTSAAGTPGRTTPGSLVISNSAAPIGQIEHTGTGAGKFGPFIPLGDADTGIRKVEQFNYNVTHTSGTTNLVLARPLLTLPLAQVGVSTERDLINQLPSMPRVYDGACLVWLMYAGAGTTANCGFYGHLDFGWG